VLTSGQYDGLGVVDIANVVCFDAQGEGAELVNAGFTVAYGAMLTLKGVSAGGSPYCNAHDDCDLRFPVVVQDAAVLMAENSSLDPLNNAGTAFLRGTSLGIQNTSSNSGVLVMHGGSVTHRPTDWFGYDLGQLGLENAGYALLDGVQVLRTQDGRKFSAGGTGILNQAGGILTLVRSTVVDNGSCDWYGDGTCDGQGIHNDGGYVEIAQSIVAGNVWGNGPDCTGDPVVDLGYNVFGPGGGCMVTEPTSTEADPLFDDPSGWIGPELVAGSPAIDLIPLELGKPTDGLGRARTDGNNDGVVACDAGALEYGYGFIEATVRARPYHWREVGTIDLSTTDLMTIYVFSTATFDATQIDFDSVEIEGFDPDAKGWPWTIDVGRDGVVDYQVTWWLNRQPPLPCGYQEHEFTATTEEGQQVRGLLKFEAVGCTG
jgi:hypothetical protein